MMMQGEATPAEIRGAIQVSRQLIYYWAKAAGLTGHKMRVARKQYVWAQLLKGTRLPEGPEPEHADVSAGRARLAHPRPSREQLAAATTAKHERMRNGKA